MDKKPSFFWAPAVGLLFPILNGIISLSGFGSFSTDAAFADYLLFFLAGALIGMVFVYSLQRSEGRAAFIAIVTAFVISIPFGLFGMALGAAVGVVGVILLGVSPSVFLIGVGYFLGRLLTGK
jgi:hypothetical protein